MKWMSIFLLIIANSLIGQSTISFIRTHTEAYKLGPGTESLTFSIPIDIVNGMPFVEAELDGQTGNFILDTGTPLMVINRSPEQDELQDASSFSASFKVGATTIQHFKWAEIEEENLEALTLDISHLEKASDRRILGMIGYNLFRNYELYFDYNKSLMVISEARNGQLHQQASPLMSIPFRMQGHLPVIELRIGDRKLLVGLDTGAEVNLLDESLMETLPPASMSQLKVEEVQGLDQSVHQVRSTYIRNAWFDGGNFCQMKFLFTDLSHLKTSSGLQIDGLLGYPFFEKMSWSINYRKQLIYVWGFD